MTPLEHKMLNELSKTKGYSHLCVTDNVEIARVAAKIALELAEKAYNVGVEQMQPLYWRGLPDVTFKQFIDEWV